MNTADSSNQEKPSENTAIAADAKTSNEGASRDDPARDMVRIREQLQKETVWERNPELCRVVLDSLLPKWQKELSGTKAWKKIRRRIVKELNESEPCIRFVQDIVQQQPTESDSKLTIVDICSGFGICSMILSEILPADRFDKILLLDKCFPFHRQESAESHQISVEHIQGRKWPIPLWFRKMNIKKAREIKQLHKYVFDPNSQLIFTGIHLCKALSVHAIQFFHSCNSAIALCLKPCCLPGTKGLYIRGKGGRKTPIEYHFANGYSFRPLDLYPSTDENSAKRAKTESADKEETNPEEDKRASSECDAVENVLSEEESNEEEAGLHRHGKHVTNSRFSQWVDCLQEGCKSPGCRVRVQHTTIMRHYFQNQIIFCEKTAGPPPAESQGV